jgi:hypothetical protein
MKTLVMWSLIAIGLLAMVGMGNATPYFRPLDISHPQPVAGALFGTSGIQDTQTTGMLPLITHSPKDGYILIPNEDWTPLAVGVSANAGQFTFDIGPLFNILPWMQTLALEVIPDKYAQIRAILAPNPGAPVTFSAGPVFQYQEATNKGYYKTFTGLALHF